MRNSHRNALLGAVFGSALAWAPPAQAADAIKIGVIAETSAISGVGIPNAAKMAAEEINKAGGINGQMIEIVDYDDHNSAVDAVRAFQRAAQQDKVAAVIASYISEVVLALEPWAGRLKMPLITPGAASNEITKRVHDDYDHMKYVFHGYLASTQIADVVCDASKSLMARDLHMKTAVIMSEDAAWTIPLDEEYMKCLPANGLKVLDHIRLSPDTTDFTPIFNKIEGVKPDVIVTGISHVGVQPTVQWQQQQVPMPMYGVSSQATNATFWKDTNGATDGVIFNMVAAPDVPVTPKTIPFAKAYAAKYGSLPGYAAYQSYDDVYMWAAAIKKAGGTDPDKMVEAMEQTDYVGTIGRVTFLPKTDTFAHGMRIGEGSITGRMVQWQKGNPVTIWPANVATGKMIFPAFTKLPQ
ncbi:MAG: branched-chain amino acid transport system substrate-binding protein [Acetobacteraceae bacterium]|nr:branched-chain amino acid transport system substrate-binding protein [Acetobacteraceae bacterium]